MSLTLGRGPLGLVRRPGNYEIVGPEHRILLEPCEKRIRVQFAGQILVDTQQARLLHETDHLPVYYFPLKHVWAGHLAEIGHSTKCPFKGRARYFDVQVGDDRLREAAWRYVEPTPRLEQLRDHVAFSLAAMDEVYEEDELVFAHPRDPYHRVDVLRSTRHVVVRHRGEVIAETTRPLAVFETSLRPRFYVPVEDVAMHQLTKSDTRTRCPYKGTTTYWSLVDGPRDVAWGYDDTLPEVSRLRGHLCFDGEEIRVDVDVERIV